MRFAGSSPSSRLRQRTMSVSLRAVLDAARHDEQLAHGELDVAVAQLDGAVHVQRWSVRSVGGSPKWGNTLLSPNQVMAEI